MAVSEETNLAAFPKARPIFQQPFPCRKVRQTLAGIAFAGKPFQQGISDSHSPLEFSEGAQRSFSGVGALHVNGLGLKKFFVSLEPSFFGGISQENCRDIPLAAGVQKV